MNVSRFCLSLSGAVLAVPPVVAQPLAIETVVVGDPGNAVDPGTGFGSVANQYHIGKHEVTNAQYASFLNAVAATDSFNLCNPSMTSDVRGGINRAGSSGSYTDSVKPGYANMPVVYVSF